MFDAAREKTRLWLLILVGVVATLVGQTHAREIFAPLPSASGEITASSPASTGDFYDADLYDVPDSLLAAKTVTVSKSKYPESYEHAQSTGKPNGPFTKDAANASACRRANLKGQEKVSGKDLDEWPPAQTAQGTGASVRPISPSDNRGSGATIGGQTRNLKDGDNFEVEWTD